MMKRKLLYLLLALEAALCVLFTIARVTLYEKIATTFSFPLALLAYGLRTLSHNGAVGNAFAMLIYAAFCLLPLWLLVRMSKKRALRREDTLLGLLSPLLFFTMYRMINPSTIGNLSLCAAEAGQIITVILGGTVYSVLFGYGILRLLRHFFESETEKLHKYIGVLLSLLSALFVYNIFATHFMKLLSNFNVLLAGNVGTEDGLGLTYVFLILQFLVDALPWALSVLTVFAALDLLSELSADRYSEETVQGAEKLSHWCGKALAATVLSNVGFNLLQLLFAGSLRNIGLSVSIPVFSVAFVASVLLLARIIAENRQLKGDNDLFI